MMIDFTNQELDIIFDALNELRSISEDDEEIILIETILDKIWKSSKNDNS